jgi:uncharacterized protein (DUF433 family)
MSDKDGVMQFPAFIEAQADVMLGKPCFKGTRISVYSILEKLAAGETNEVIPAAYPQLKPEHIKASLAYARSSSCFKHGIWTRSATQTLLTRSWAESGAQPGSPGGPYQLKTRGRWHRQSQGCIERTSEASGEGRD